MLKKICFPCQINLTILERPNKKNIESLNLTLKINLKFFLTIKSKSVEIPRPPGYSSVLLSRNLNFFMVAKCRVQILFHQEQNYLLLSRFSIFFPHKIKSRAITGSPNLEFRSKFKLGDQLIIFRTISKVGGLIV